MDTSSPRFLIGMILLFTNQIFGWGGIIFFSYLAKKTSKKYFYALGTIVYIISLGMLALGAYLVEPAGLKLLRKYIPDWLGLAVAAAVALFFVLRGRAKRAVINKKQSDVTTKE